VVLACRLDSYFNVLAKGGEEIDQTAHGEVAGAIARKCRYLGLRNAENFPSFRLGKATVLDDAVDCRVRRAFISS